MINKYEVKLLITTLKSGQARRYDDSEYEFEIESSGIGEWNVKQYCTKILQPCLQTKEQWKNNSLNIDGGYFYGYYEFEKIGENKYRYYVFVPYCD